MAAKVNPNILTEHLGVPGESADFRAIYEAVRVQLQAHPERRDVFDGRPSVRLRQLEDLRDALRDTDAGARFLVEGLTTDRAGFPKSEIDFKDIEGRIEEAIDGLRMETAGSSAKQRSTEVARNFTAQELARIFKHYYRLQSDDYRAHLDAFLRSLFLDNDINYPKPHDDYKQRDDLLVRIGVI